MLSQLKIGNNTEDNTSSFFRQKGFWVHKMPKTQNGQSVDMIAIREKFFMVFDAKHVRKEDISFTFSRIESNQETSMDYMKNFAKIPSDRLGFVIHFERLEEYKFLPYDTYLDLKSQGVKSINGNDKLLMSLNHL